MGNSFNRAYSLLSIDNNLLYFLTYELIINHTILDPKVGFYFLHVGYICELSPCQNGGSCTLVSAPSDYICDCTGTGYQGINCSTPICKYNSVKTLFTI